MASRNDGPNICDTCRDIDFANLLAESGQLNQPNLQDYKLVHSLEREMCAVLTPTQYAGQESQLRSYLNSHGSDIEAWTGNPGVYACFDADWASRDVAHAYQPIVLRVDVGRQSEILHGGGEVQDNGECQDNGGWQDSGEVQDDSELEDCDRGQDSDQGCYSDGRQDSNGRQDSDGRQDNDERQDIGGRQDSDDGWYSDERQDSDLPQIRYDLVEIRSSQIVFCTPQDLNKVHTLWMPCPLHKTPDYAAARVWLNDCQNSHGVDCNSMANRVQGMRLVDVLDRKIVREENLTSPHWLTLSYVWGQFPSIQPSGTNTLPDHLPRTVEDAIAVTGNLGYRYLWVDELCIDQFDPAHRTSQIGKMDQIYQGADLTTVAAFGDNKNCGLPGVGMTPRKKSRIINLQTATVFSIGPDPRYSLRASIWWTRAWTFQEGYLSRRLLVFTEHQMTFYCRETAWMEALLVPPNLNSATLHVDLSHLWISLWDLRLDSSDATSRSFPPLIHFEILVGKYIDRNMSYLNDILNAAAGVLHQLGQGDDQVLNIAGLPYYRGSKGAKKLTSLEHVIGHALGWFTNREPCIRRAMFPSWTWAGWSGLEDVGWMWLTPKEEKYFLHNVQLENEFGELLVLPEHIEAASTSILQRGLDTVKAIVFEAPCLPVTAFTVEDSRVHVPGYWFQLHGVVTVHEAESMNAQKGLWSCFLLRIADRKFYDPVHIKHGNSTILLCRWVDEGTAERFAQLNTGRGACDSDIGCFETLGKIRRVRLV